MLKYLIFTLFASISLTNANTACYGDLGCFSNAKPFCCVFERPIGVLPESPTKINTIFTLFNRKQSAGEVVTASNLGYSFDASLPTKFIVHGFLDHGKKPWIIGMKNALIFRDEVNVITVDWSKGNGFPYDTAVANTRIVGAEIAKLINAFINNNGASAKDFHIIGHSLGAHIAGYAGERVQGLGKITGLDPAWPTFQNNDIITRLDPTDAVFVEAIHTDAIKPALVNANVGLGMMQAVGHVDFYVNGGLSQPGCPDTPGKILNAILGLVTLDISTIEEGLSCSHTAAHTYYTESILSDSCKFTAYKCSSEADFNAGKCISCSAAGCNRMGYASSPTKDLGTLYLNTQSPKQLPLCKQNYVLTVYSNYLSGLQQAKGKFTIYFKTETETSKVYVFDDSSVEFKQGSVHSRLISLTEPLSKSVQSVFISYNRTIDIFTFWLYMTQWSFKYVELKSGDAQTTVKLCPVSNMFGAGVTVEFKAC